MTMSMYSSYSPDQEMQQEDIFGKFANLFYTRENLQKYIF